VCTDFSRLFALFTRVPFGGHAFSVLVGLFAPYSGSVSATVLELTPTRARVRMRDRPWLRNPFGCIHAVALTNLAELTSGIVVMCGLHRPVEDIRQLGIITRFTSQFVKKARGPITCTCEVELPRTLGVHDYVTESVCRDQSGDVVARVTVTWTIRIERIHDIHSSRASGWIHPS